MTVFISYARKDDELVDVLARDIVRAKQQVWLDHDLTGGQDWWDTILGQIRDCRVFIFVLTPASIRSKACLAELGYAANLGRPIVPVMVRDVAVQLAPQSIARVHIVDYRERNADAAVDLMNALVTARSPGPLPAPLPEPPTLPGSYASVVRDQIGADSLTPQQQGLMLMELKAHLGDAEERGVALELLHDLRRRSDITEVVAREVDGILAGQPVAADQTTGEPEEVSADAEPGAAHARDWHPVPRDDSPNEQNKTVRDAERQASTVSEEVADGGRRRAIELPRPTTRRTAILAVLGAVVVLAVLAMIALLRDGGEDSDALDVESVEDNYRAIVEEGNVADRCLLGDLSVLVTTIDDVVQLPKVTVDDETSSFELGEPDDRHIRCGIDIVDSDEAGGIVGFQVVAAGRTAELTEAILSELGAEESVDYRNGRIMQLEQTGDYDGGKLCASYWLSDDVDVSFAVELYGGGCTLEASSLALQAVLPDMVESLASSGSTTSTSVTSSVSITPAPPSS